MAPMHRNGAARLAKSGSKISCLGRALSCLWLGPVACDAQADPAYEGEPLISIFGRVEAPLGVGDVDVGVLWLRPASDPVDAAVECTIELSGELPSPCVAACGSPTCEQLSALEAWEVCASQCEGPSGVSEIVIETQGDRLFEGAVGQRTSVQGAFPAQFRLHLLEPPPDDVLTVASTGERLAVGFFVALDPRGAPFELDLEASSFPEWLLGGSGSHVLMFSADGVPRSSQWGSLLEVELPPGFQLMEVGRVDGVDQQGRREEGEEYRPVPALDSTRVNLIVADPATIEWPLAD